MSKTLIKYIPHHSVYVEPFGGGASLLFAKEPSGVEIYNDINSGLVSLFRVLRDEEKFQEFYGKVLLTPYSREEFLYCKDTWFCEADEIEKAYKFFIVYRQSFAIRNDSLTWSYANKVYDTVKHAGGMIINKWLNALDRLPAIHDRVKLLQVEHADFIDVLDRYDSSDTFFYIDPPYYSSEDYYDAKFVENDHARLLNKLVILKGKVMVSNYPNELYSVLTDIGWNYVEVRRRRESSVLNSSHNIMVSDAIWMNYSL